MPIYDANGNVIETGGETKDALIPLTQNVKSTAADYFSMWEHLVTDGFCTKTQIATVNSQPIYKYVFAFDKDTLSGDKLMVVSDGSYFSKPKISIISGQHGNEKGSPLYLYEFMNRLCTNEKYRKYFGMFDIHVIPLVNPTGYNANTRDNYQHININRDATATPQTVEGQALKAHFDTNNWAACFDLHQMSSGHGTAYAHSCAYFSMHYNAPKDTTDKFNKIFTTEGYKMEKLMEDYSHKTTHKQMFQPWEGSNSAVWRNYPVDVVEKTDLSFCLETAQTWYYYSDSSVDLNPTALIGGNTYTDKVMCAFLDNL